MISSAQSVHRIDGGSILRHNIPPQAREPGNTVLIHEEGLLLYRRWSGKFWWDSTDQLNPINGFERSTRSGNTNIRTIIGCGTAPTANSNADSVLYRSNLMHFLHNTLVWNCEKVFGCAIHKYLGIGSFSGRNWGLRKGSCSLSLIQQNMGQSQQAVQASFCS